MKAPAPQETAALGPRNLTVPLGAWLRRLGFRVLEHGGAAPTGLAATWAVGVGTGYGVTYLYSATQGGLLRLTRHTPALPERVLVDTAVVRRLREARLLLLTSVFYRADRREALAAGTLQPTAAGY
jgi:hypothetical protein